MAPDIKKYLYDIKESIDSIEIYLGNKRNFSAYLNNKMLRRGVEREFEIIGEALKNDVVWGVIVRHLPILKQEVQCLFDNNQSIE